MNGVKTLMKIAAALAAVGAAVFVVYKFWDKIVEKAEALKSRCPLCARKSDFVCEMEPEEEAEAPAAEEPVEEAPAEEAPAEEAAEEVVTEADFAD